MLFAKCRKCVAFCAASNPAALSEHLKWSAVHIYTFFFCRSARESLFELQLQTESIIDNHNQYTSVEIGLMPAAYRIVQLSDLYGVIGM